MVINYTLKKNVLLNLLKLTNKYLFNYGKIQK